MTFEGGGSVAAQAVSVIGRVGCDVPKIAAIWELVVVACGPSDTTFEGSLQSSGPFPLVGKPRTNVFAFLMPTARPVMMGLAGNKLRYQMGPSSMGAGPPPQIANTEPEEAVGGGFGGGGLGGGIFGGGIGGGAHQFPGSWSYADDWPAMTFTL